MKTYVNLEGPIFHKTNATKSIIFARKNRKIPFIYLQDFYLLLQLAFLFSSEAMFHISS